MQSMIASVLVNIVKIFGSVSSTNLQFKVRLGNIIHCFYLDLDFVNKQVLDQV